MNFCPSCGNKIEQSDNFCSKCGKKINNKKVNNVKEENDLALTGFILSIISFLTCGLFSILAFIFSLLGLLKTNKENGYGKGLSIAGIALSTISFLLLLTMLFYFICVIWLVAVI